MKTRLFLLTTILCVSIVPANTNFVEIIINPIPLKKAKQNAKKGSDCFLYSSKLFKVNSFCKLIQAGHYNAVKSCIAKGIDLNKISNKLTPLMYAARHNRVAIVKLLIEKGAKLKIKSNHGHTALKWAKLSNATESYNLIANALNNSKN